MKSGKVKYVFHHIVDLGSNRLSEAAECAGDQNKFWEMHHLLFERQGEASGRTIDQTLTGYARELGLDGPAFTQCLTSNKYTQLVKGGHEWAKANSIRIRPTFAINERRIQGALPWPQFQAQINQALAQKR